MPLTGPQRTWLARGLTLLRNDWDPAGCHAAVARIGDHPAPAITLAATAIEQAANAANRTPDCITWTQPAAQPAEHHTSRTPRPACPTHGNPVIHVPTGAHLCCQQATSIPNDQPCNDCQPLLTHRPDQPMET